MKNVTTYDLWDHRGRLTAIGWALTRRAALERVLEDAWPTDVAATVTSPSMRERFVRRAIGAPWETTTTEERS